MWLKTKKSPKLSISALMNDVFTAIKFPVLIFTFFLSVVFFFFSLV